MLIRSRTHSSGTVVWQVDLGTVGGVRQRKLYKSETAAKAALAKAKSDKAKLGKTGMVITPEEAADVILARERLGPLGITIGQAVDFYLAHHGSIKEVIALEELRNRFVESRKEASLSQRYIWQLGVSLGSLVALYPDREAAGLSRADVEAWLGAAGWATRTRINYLGDVRAMFSWGIKQKYVARSPCEGIEINRRALDEEEIRRLPVEDCKVLLEAARGQQHLMTYLVLAMFCGIRPAEIERMSWEAVDLEDKHAIVAARHAKTRKKRVVDLSDNAVAWIKSCGAPGEGKICGRGFEDAWIILRRRLGWAAGDDHSNWLTQARKAAAGVPVTRGEWIHDVLRHTFASMHYAHHQNESALQTQMGHESADMLHTHYRGLVKRSEAAAFWALMP